jgi:diguanylate cyclase (GGDEF)-like protein/PAS domain S-box-containing protein
MPLKKFRVIPNRNAPDIALGMGFAAVLALMLFMTAVGLLQLEASQNRLEGIVGDHLAKVSLATRMHSSARERTVSLQQLTILRDPFERDEQWMRYLSKAGEFGQARQALLALPLTAEEESLLKRQSQLTGIAVPIQERVVKLVSEGNILEAQRLLVAEAIPAQDHVLQQLSTLYQLQERKTEQIVQQAARDFHKARLQVTLLAAITVGLALLVAVTVVRYSRRADSELRQEKERAQVTLHSLSDAVIRAGADGRIEYLNPIAVRLTGWTNQSAHGKYPEEIFNVVRDSVCDTKIDAVGKILTGKESTTGPVDFVISVQDATQYCIELISTPIHNDLGEVAGMVMVFRDVTEIRALSRELMYHATHDPLTGLYNRREFERHLQEALLDARASDVEYALCYLDLDMFKVVNDTCGHVAGDELLKQISLMFRQRLRKEDILARIGGDEFAILLRRCTLERAEEISGLIRVAMKDFRFVWEEKTVDVGVSIGVMRIAADSGDIKDVFRIADVACRIAKEEGRNRIHLFRPNDLTVTRREREIDWVQRISRAVSENQFVLYGQWIRPLGHAQNKLSHCEVLLHLRDESGEVVTPTAFLPAAERYQLMPVVDRWVVRAALSTLRNLQSEALQRLGCFNINLSGQSLCDPDFLTFVLSEIKTSGVAPEQICFEVTETEAVSNLSNALHLIKCVKEMGCRFALDDFGSGMSSFSYLKNMPVDYLKIDGSFVRNIADDQIDLAMVSSINQVAHIMGIETIAEYVESDAIRVALDGLGVDYGQGFALAQPMPLEAMLQELSVARIRKIS